MLSISQSFKILIFEELDSTNQKLYQLATNGIEHKTVIWAKSQPHGKGYSGNLWKTEPGKNLTFSFLLNDFCLEFTELPVLNMWVAVCVQSFLTKCQFKAKIKWPNDIIISNKKCGGILIENKLSKTQTGFVVIGIGINLYQTDFAELTKATSLVLENPDFKMPVEDFMKGLLSEFEIREKLWTDKKFDKIRNEYHNCLFKKGKVAVYELDGKKYNGILNQVNLDGTAEITLENLGTNNYRHKELFLLY